MPYPEHLSVVSASSSDRFAHAVWQEMSFAGKMNPDLETGVTFTDTEQIGLYLVSDAKMRKEEFLMGFADKNGLLIVTIHPRLGRGKSRKATAVTILNWIKAKREEHVLKEAVPASG